MALDLEHALSELAHTPPVGDDSFPADGMAATVRRMATHVRRRRAARYAGTSVVGAAAVAAIAVGGSAVRSHDTLGPATSLSRRAGAECDKPFDAAGKSDAGVAGELSYDAEVGSDGRTPVYGGNEKYLRMNLTPLVGDNLNLLERMSVSPVTAVILRSGVVVGITTVPSIFEVMPLPTPMPTNAPAWDTTYFVPIAELTNCLGVAPPALTDDMFEVVMLANYALPGRSGTALVITPSASVPHQNVTDPGQSRTGRHVQVFSTDQTDPNATKLAFDTAYYSTFKDVAGTNIPLYAAPDGYPKPNTAPITGPFDAHASGQGSVVITCNGAAFLVITDADMYL